MSRDYKKQKINPQKKEMVEFLKNKMSDSKTVGVLDFTGLPSKQLGHIRHKLRDHIQIKMAKKSLIQRAIEKTGDKKLKDVEDKLENQVALAFSDFDSFKLYSVINKEQSKAPAKEGQVAPNDITVKAGGTGIPPGPTIGDFQKVGLPAKIEGGQIVIKNDKVLVKKGDEISKIQADVLSKLGIEPMKIGITLTYAFSDGDIYTADQLHVDIDEVFAKFSNAHTSAFALAMEIGYMTKETVTGMIAKASTQATALGVASGQIEAQVQSPVAESIKEDEKKEEETEEISEEEASAGLGALFG